MKDHELSDLQKVQLNILIELDRVCHENNLHYYLAFGTCLGALRHKGFIPWDDDIDVLMPIRDVKKLIHLQNKFEDKYFVQSKETDPEYGSISVRIRNSETTLIEKDEQNLNINHGIYIDVYPFYEAPATKVGLTLNVLKSHVYKVLSSGRIPQNHGKSAKILATLVLNTYGLKHRKKKASKIEREFMKVKGKEILDYYGQDITLLSAITYPKEWFETPRKLEFEGLYFDGPTEPEKYMTKRYGDYMKLPPVEDQVKHHTYVYMNAHQSYKEYFSSKEK